MKRKLPKGEYAWAFAIVNGKLAEIHFSIRKGVKGIWGHCYVCKTSRIQDKKRTENDRRGYKEESFHMAQ